MKLWHKVPPNGFKKDFFWWNTMNDGDSMIKGYFRCSKSLSTSWLPNCSKCFLDLKNSINRPSDWSNRDDNSLEPSVINRWRYIGSSLTHFHKLITSIPSHQSLSPLHFADRSFKSTVLLACQNSNEWTNMNASIHGPQQKQHCRDRISNVCQSQHNICHCICTITDTK